MSCKLCENEEYVYSVREFSFDYDHDYDNLEITFEGDFESVIVHVDINYCPKCGKKLKVKK